VSQPRTRFLAAAAGLILAAASCAPSDTTEPTTLTQALEQSARRGVPVLIDFYTDW
jgi:hypothetical protein